MADVVAVQEALPWGQRWTQILSGTRAKSTPTHGLFPLQCDQCLDNCQTTSCNTCVEACSRVHASKKLRNTCVLCYTSRHILRSGDESPGMCPGSHGVMVLFARASSLSVASYSRCFFFSSSLFLHSSSRMLFCCSRRRCSAISLFFGPKSRPILPGSVVHETVRVGLDDGVFVRTPLLGKHVCIKDHIHWQQNGHHEDDTEQHPWIHLRPGGEGSAGWVVPRNLTKLVASFVADLSLSSMVLVGQSQ